MNPPRVTSYCILLPIALLLPMFAASAYAQQDNRPLTTVEQNERITGLERQLEQLRKSDAEHREAISALQKRSNGPRTWPETIPWFALAAGGIAFAISWWFANRRSEAEQTKREKEQAEKEKKLLELGAQEREKRELEITKRAEAIATALASIKIQAPSTANKLIDLLGSYLK